MITRMPSATAAVFRMVGRYQGRSGRWVVSRSGVSLNDSGDCRSFFRQMNGLRSLFGFLFGSVMVVSSPLCKSPGDQTVESRGGRGPALDQHVVMRQPPCFLAQFRRQHLLHVCLATEICDLSLRCKIRIGPRRTERYLVLHLVGGVENHVARLIGD